MTSSLTASRPRHAGADSGEAAARRLRSVWALTAVLLVFAGLAWTVIIVRAEPLVSRPWPWFVFAAGFALGRHLRVELKSAGGDSMSFVMTDIAFVVTVMLAAPFAVPVGVAVGALVAWISFRPPVVKAVFNTAQELAGTAVATATFVIARGDELVSARTGFAAIAAALVMGLFSHHAVALVSRLASGSRTRAPLRSLMISSIGSIGHGIVAVEAVYLGSLAVPLALLPVLMISVLYLGYLSVRSQQQSTDRTELLYRATAALYEQPNIDDGLLSALEHFRTTLHASAARLVLLADKGAVTCGVNGDDHGWMPMTAAQPVEESAARRLAAELPGAVLLREGTPAVTSGPISVFAESDAIAAPISRHGQPAGVVLVYGQRDSSQRLGQPDVDLVELMATQIGSALESGFLERTVAQIVELERELNRKSFYDAVTNLPNRNLLHDELDHVLELETAHGHAVLLLDLDDFKTVNDSLGHIAGDQLLAVVAQRIVGCIGDHGIVARLGGDEFAVLLTEVGSAAAVERTAAAVIAAVSQMVHLDGRDVSVGASVGIRMTSPGDRPTEVLRDADMALYNAKSLGKGRFARYEPAMHVQAQERLSLASSLSNAVERDEFVVVFQPIFDLLTGSVVGAEALVRWQHPERGEISPSYFLTMAEETGLIVSIGLTVLRKALHAVSELLPVVGAAPFHVAVNVSARQLREDGVARALLGVIEESGVPPSRLVLEITESIFIDDAVQTKAILDQVAAAGVRIGLDDFGTGYSSLSQLQRLPLHQLKIDRSFVRRLGPDRDGRVVVRAIIQLAAALHLETIAEGIETTTQFDELVQLGCRRGQGWLMARPMPAAALAELLGERARP